MKLNLRQTILIGLGAICFSLIWTTYNLFVPLLLQAGDAVFDAQHGSDLVGFGLSAGMTGLIMTLDNIAAVVIAPFIGILSDRTRTRWGRRFPFILGSLPMMVICFTLIPFSVYGRQAGMNISGRFWLFLLAAGLTILSVAVFRTPVRALMPDLTPSPLRSKANGVIEFMGGIASVLTAVAIASTFDIRPWLPFAISAALVAVAILTLALTIREPDPASLAQPASSPSTAADDLKEARLIPAETRRSLIFLLLAIFGLSLGYSALETFYSSYAVTILGVSASGAARTFAAALVAFIFAAIPAGYIGERIGRKTSMLIGLSTFAAILLIMFLVPGMIVNAPILAIGGISWALISVNMLPMVLDSTTDARLAGTYTGLFYLALQAASIAAPILTGAAIDWMGRNYEAIFLITLISFILAIILLIFVKHGEAQDGPMLKASQQAVPID